MACAVARLFTVLAARIGSWYGAVWPSSGLVSLVDCFISDHFHLPRIPGCG